MSDKILSLPSNGSAPPKLPSLPPGASVVQIRSKVEIQTTKEARIEAARKTAHVVDHSEQAKREETAKLRASQARKGSRGEAKLFEAKMADPKAPKVPEVKPAKVVRASMALLTGDVRPMSADTGSKLLAAMVSVLGEDCTTQSAKLAEGVCLALWVRTVKVNPMTGIAEDYSVCVQRKWYATIEGAHQAGKAALADDKCTSFVVNDTVYRSDVLSGARQIARDQIIPSRKKGAICQSQNHNKTARWQKAGQTRVTFSHG